MGDFSTLYKEYDSCAELLKSVLQIAVETGNEKLANAQHIGKFTNDRLDVPDILDLLRSYETLYPYKVFASSEYVITWSHCSLCGKSMQCLGYSYLKGNLYWGKPAMEVIGEIKEIQSVFRPCNPCFVEF